MYGQVLLRLYYWITVWLRLEGASAGYLVQPPLLKKGHLEPGSQDCVQMGFDCLRGWRLHNVSGQHVAVLSQVCLLEQII